jgi:DNA-binding CsgD family transcriptional regulator
MRRGITHVARISRRTARFHLRSVYDKLGVNSCTEATIWAVKQNLDEVPQR